MGIPTYLSVETLHRGVLQFHQQQLTLKAFNPFCLQNLQTNTDTHVAHSAIRRCGSKIGVRLLPRMTVSGAGVAVPFICIMPPCRVLNCKNGRTHAQACMHCTVFCQTRALLVRQETRHLAPSHGISAHAKNTRRSAVTWKLLFTPQKFPAMSASAHDDLQYTVFW